MMIFKLFLTMMVMTTTTTTQAFTSLSNIPTTKTKSRLLSSQNKIIVAPDMVTFNKSNRKFLLNVATTSTDEFEEETSFRGTSGVAASSSSSSSLSSSKSSSSLFAGVSPPQRASKTIKDNNKSLSSSSSSFTESTLRSAVKSLAWRVVAGSVTFVTSYRFSKSISTALSIVGSDFASKALTMFIGERLMNNSQAGRESGNDAASRSLVKALIWRLFAVCNTLCLAVFVSHDFSIASKIAGSDAIFKTALMFVYERAWARIHWGKVPLLEKNRNNHERRMMMIAPTIVSTSSSTTALSRATNDNIVGGSNSTLVYAS